MASAYLERRTYRPQSQARRIGALLLALGLVALLILALLRLGALPPRPFGGRSLSTFDVLPEGERQAAAPRREERRVARRAAPPPATPPPLPPPPPVPFKAPPGMIILTRDEMASADIDRMPRAAKGADVAAAETGGDTPSVGGGPGGERLYEAEWYREPPRNALQLYLPNGAPPGAWATIACRTIERYHVDSCVQLDDFPKGLGLSRALRSAAWQFLVRPPRLGGKPLVGAWVRIRFTFEAEPARRP